jgi:DNA polymerase-3 subunit alpha
MNGNSSTGMLRELLMPHLARASGGQGLPVRIHYQSAAASCEAMLGADWKVVPSDEALTALRLALSPDSVSTLYE